MYIHTMTFTFSFNMTHIKQSTRELKITPVQMHMKVEIWSPSQVTALSEIRLWTCTLKVLKNSHPQLYINVFQLPSFCNRCGSLSHQTIIECRRNESYNLDISYLFFFFIPSSSSISVFFFQWVFLVECPEIRSVVNTRLRDFQVLLVDKKYTSVNIPH